MTAAMSLRPTEAERKALLACGILAAAVYIGTDVASAVLYPGYSFTGQAVSELFAIGAPTSRLVVPLFTLSSILLAAFSFGVWGSAGQNRSLQFMAASILVCAINGVLLWNFFPMHMRGAARTLTDTMHLVLAANPFVLLSLVCGLVAFRKRFRSYTLVTIATLLLPAIFAFRYAPAIAANQPTPGLGLSERFAQYSYQLWQVVLAIVLIRSPSTNRS